MNYQICVKQSTKHVRYAGALFVQTMPGKNRVHKRENLSQRERGVQEAKVMAKKKNKTCVVKIMKIENSGG